MMLHNKYNYIIRDSGLEGITWIPDTVLTNKKFIDESTDSLYDPENYSNHGNGLFLLVWRELDMYTLML